MAVSRGLSEFSHNGVQYAINDPNNAPEFSPSTEYRKGQFVYRGGSLYKFTANHPASAWNASHVEAVMLSSELLGVADDLDDEIVARTQGDAGKVNKPASLPNGTNGQYLKSLGNGETEWASVEMPTDAQVETAVDAWLDAHPEATTTVEDGAIAEDQVNKSLLRTVMPPLGYHNVYKRKRNKIQDGLLASYYIQSMCYDSAREHYIFGFTKSDNSECLILVTTGFDLSDDNNIVTSFTGDFGHCGDMTYDPQNDKIYIAPLDSREVVYVLDPADSYSSSTVSTTGFVPKQIEMYSNGDIYIGTEAVGRRYASDFSEYTEIETGKVSKAQSYIGKTGLVLQGCFNLDDKIYTIFGERDYTDISSSWRGAYLAAYRDNEILYVRRIAYQHEIESAFSDGHIVYFVCGQTYVQVIESDFEITNEEMRPLAIRKFDDLDDYLDEGRYYSANSTVTGTLTNAPETCITGFYMDVRDDYEVIKQEIFSSTNVQRNVKYIRNYIVSEEAWGPWFRLVLDDDAPTKYDGLICCGYVTSAGKTIRFSVPIPYYDFIVYYKTFSVTIRQNGYYIVGDANAMINLKKADMMEIYSLEAANAGHGNTVLTLTKVDETAFSNATNNDTCAILVYASKADPNE